MSKRKDDIKYFQMGFPVRDLHIYFERHKIRANSLFLVQNNEYSNEKICTNIYIDDKKTIDLSIKESDRVSKIFYHDNYLILLYLSGSAIFIYKYNMNDFYNNQALITSPDYCIQLEGYDFKRKLDPEILCDIRYCNTEAGLLSIPIVYQFNMLPFTKNNVAVLNIENNTMDILSHNFYQEIEKYFINPYEEPEIIAPKNLIKK